MKHNEILQAAKETGLTGLSLIDVGYLERFAAIIEKRTIERCAVVCDVEWNGDSDTYEYSIAANDLAAAIRKLGEQ